MFVRVIFTFSHYLFFNLENYCSVTKRVIRQFGGLQLLRLSMPCVLVALAACGGGGGGTSTSGGSLPPAPPPVSRTPAPSSETVARSVYPTRPESYYLQQSEYQGQIGLSIVRAAKAYSRGLTGTGVRLGFTDTGLDSNHVEFRDKNILLNDRTGYGSVTPTAQQLAHGTAVASVATAHFGNGVGMHGVAFNSDLAMFSLRLNSNNTLEISDRIFNGGLQKLNQVSSDIMNHSWGLSVLYNPNYYGSQKRMLDIEYSQSVRTMAAGNALHVWSAGNEGGSQVSATAALPLYFPELRDKSVVVVAVDSNGLIGHDSNHCGSAKAFCLAAPGGYNRGAALVRGAYPGGGYQSVVGTSFAAPHVAGVLALMKELFGDQLSNQEYINRLLVTADNTGVYADSDTYGHGLVNADAATNPVGPTAVVMSRTRIPVDESGFNLDVLGHVVDDYIEQREIVVHDSLDAPFSVPLKTFSLSERKTHKSDEAQVLSSGVIHKQAPTSKHGFAMGDAMLNVSTFAYQPAYQFAALTPVRATGQPAHTAMTAPYLSLMPPVLGGQVQKDNFKFAGFWGHRAEQQKNGLDAAELNNIFGFTGSWGADFGRLRLSTQTGLVMEEKAIFGAYGQGAFALDGLGESLYVGLGGEMAWGNGWTSGFGIYVGQSEVEGKSDGLVDSISAVQSVAYETVLWKQFENWQFYSRLKRPLRMQSGALRLRLPVARIAGGGVMIEEESLSLIPDGQETQLALGGHIYYGQSIWGFDIEFRHQPEHNKHADDLLSIGGNWRWRF